MVNDEVKHRMHSPTLCLSQVAQSSDGAVVDEFGVCGWSAIHGAK